MKTIARIIAVALALLWVAPSQAQFAAQSTWAGTAGGTANAITLAISNWNRNLAGVPLDFLPSADNSTSVTVRVNGVGSPVALLKPTNQGLAALSGGELRSGVIATVAFDGTQFVLQVPLGKFADSSALANSALSFGAPVNLQINATVSANALTIAIKTSASADATAATPILVPFRDVTIASGAPSVVPIVAALSLTIASTSTMGCVSGQMCRLWVVLFNNAGTAVLGAFNALSGANVAPINEAAVQTCASGTSGGSSAQTYYCSTSAVTAKSIRIVGYVEVQEATAGTWATGPTYVQLFGPGIKKAGDVVQERFVSTGAVATGSTPIATADAVPQITDGDQYMSLSITPSSAANVIQVESNGYFAANANSLTVVAALFQGAGPGASSTGFQYTGVANAVFGIHVGPVSLLPNSTSSVTYSLRAGAASNTTTFNGTNGVRVLGGTLNSFIKIKEIMSAIEPANDNDAFDDCRAVG